MDPSTFFERRGTSFLFLLYFCCWRVGDEKIKKDGVIIHRVNRVGDNMKSDWKSRSHGLLFDQKYFTGFFVAHGRMIARVVVSTFSQVARIIIIYILFILYIWSYMYIQFFGSVQCTSMYIQFFGSVQSVWLDFRQNWSSDTGVMRWSEVWCWDERLCVGWFNDRTFDRNNICWDGFEMLKKLGACVQSSMALGWFHVKEIVRIMLTSDTPWLSGFFCAGAQVL